MKRAMRALASGLICATALAASPSPSPSASLDKKIVQRVIRSHLLEVRYCYELSLRDKPGLEGRVVVQLTIDWSGRVIASHVESSTLADAAAEKCIGEAPLRWEFPKPVGGGSVIVSYPFVLTLDAFKSTRPGRNR